MLIYKCMIVLWFASSITSQTLHSFFGPLHTAINSICPLNHIISETQDINQEGLFLLRVPSSPHQGVVTSIRDLDMPQRGPEEEWGEACKHSPSPACLPPVSRTTQIGTENAHYYIEGRVTQVIRLKESQGQLNKLPICVAKPHWLHFVSFILGPQSCPLPSLHNWALLYSQGVYPSQITYLISFYSCLHLIWKREEKKKKTKTGRMPFADTDG